MISRSDALNINYMQKRTRLSRKPRTYPQVCWYCESESEPDYKETTTLTKFVTERGKIIDRAKSGLCARHQRRVTNAVKRARFIALMPFVIRS